MRKWILCALLAITAPSYARDIAYMANDIGGVIVLTDEACYVAGKHYANLRRIYASIPNERGVIEGCFFLKGDTIQAIFETQHERTYPASKFTIIRQQKREMI